jgi:hypothetical protein
MAKKKGAQPVGEIQDDGSWEKTLYVPEVDAAHKVRVDRIEKDLSLRLRAAKDGQNNHPQPDEKTLNEPQMEICNRVFSGILMLNQFLSEQVSSAVKSARRMIPRHVDAEGVRDEITATVEGVFQDYRQRLAELRYADLAKERELKYFRYVNGLNRGAHYKDSTWLVAGLLLTLFLGECVLNGLLLSSIMTSGILGGVALAAAISLINIASGVAAGLYGWRMLGHHRRELKVLGGVIMAVCHLGALFWNLLVAHFRDVAEIAAADPNFDFDMARLSAETMAAISAQGFFGLSSMPSWGLFILGMLIHLFAAKEGWDDFADRYPDYKKYDKRAHEAREEYEGTLDEARAAARDAVEAIEEDIKQAASRATAAHRGVCDLLNVVVQRRQEVKDSEDEWAAGGSQLLQSYRAANIAVRNSTPPGYFETFPSADDYRRRNFGGGLSPSDEVEKQVRALDAAVEELRELRDSAKLLAEHGDEVMRNVRRHITQAVRKLDRILEDEEQRATQKAEERLREHPADGSHLRLISEAVDAA